MLLVISLRLYSQPSHAVAGDIKADGHSWVESCARDTADSIASGDDGPGDGKSVEVIAIFAGIVSL